MIVIDGSFGEGGGQILRTSLSLAALTGQAVSIENIRAKRDKPGLRPQHLTGAIAIAEICGADLTGAEEGSMRLVFNPRKIKPGHYEFDVSKVRASAGSVNLIFQTILWPLAFAEKRSRVVIRGGTHVPFSPTSNYIEQTFLPTVRKMGIVCNYRMLRAGYYPAGGGEIVVDIEPSKKMRAIVLDGPSTKLTVALTSAVSNLHSSIAERQLNTGIARLKELGITPQHTEITKYPSPGKGTVFFIEASSEGAMAGFQSLGELKKRAETVAEEACEEFESYYNSGMAIDKHLADQLIIPIALAEGLSRFTTCEITQHLLTNVAVVERFLDVRFKVTGELGNAGTVERIR